MLQLASFSDAVSSRNLY